MQFVGVICVINNQFLFIIKPVLFTPSTELM